MLVACLAAVGAAQNIDNAETLANLSKAVTAAFPQRHTLCS